MNRDDALPQSPDHSPSLGSALVAYEPWLHWLADLEIGSRFQGKFSASDVVQQTMLAAWRDWDHFEGQEGPQRRVWLRSVLAHQLAQLARHYAGTQKRDVNREQAIEHSLAQSSLRLEQLLPAEQSSPSGRAIVNENLLQLAAALGELPEDYRQVIQLRNFAGLPHAEVARRMNRSPGAIRMLWTRALAALSEQLSAE